MVNIQNYFKCGNINIDNRATEGFKFVVNNRSDIKNIIIPHFEKYPLVGSKHLDFLAFKYAVNLSILYNNVNLDEILTIKDNMNNSRKFEERYEYLEKKTFDLDPLWVVGFIDGEGSFQGGVSKLEGDKFKVSPTLEIAQSTHDVLVLDTIRNYFSCGYMKPEYDIKDITQCLATRPVSRLVINQYKTIIEFFEKYSLNSSKLLDYLAWVRIIELKTEKYHLTPEGIKEIEKIRGNMNKFRTSNNHWIVNDKDKKSYHTKINRTNNNINNYNDNNNNILLLLYSALMFSLFITFFLLNFNIMHFLEMGLSISFFYLLTILYIDNYKLSENKYIKILQISIFILYTLYLIISISSIFDILPVQLEPGDGKKALENTDIVLKGKVVLDKDAGTEVAKGLTNLGSNVGLGASIGAVAGGVSKAIASSNIPANKKAAMVVLSGLAGAAIHTGASAINAKRAADSAKRAAESAKDIDNYGKPSSNIHNDSPFDWTKYFSTDESTSSFLEDLVWSIYILNTISLLLFILLISQYIFIYYVNNEPKLNFIYKLLPKYSNTIKKYIYKFIKFAKSTDKYTSIFIIVLLLICLISSYIFSFILYTDLQSYVDYYINK